MTEHDEVTVAGEKVALLLAKGKSTVDVPFALTVLVEVLASLVLSGPENEIDSLAEKISSEFLKQIDLSRPRSTGNGSMLQ